MTTVDEAVRSKSQALRCSEGEVYALMARRAPEVADLISLSDRAAIQKRARLRTGAATGAYAFELTEPPAPAPSGPAEREVLRRARLYAERHKVSEAEAVLAVLKQSPGLYDASARHRRGGVVETVQRQQRFEGKS